MKTIILGVGNPILSDDGVGIHVAEQLKQKLRDPNVVIDEAFTGGMNLLDMMYGYDKAILVDAINLSNAQEGEVKRLQIQDFSSIHSTNPHDVTLLEAIQLAKMLGEHRIPNEIIVIGIVIKSLKYEFGDTLSPIIAKAVPKAVNMAMIEIEKKNKNSTNWGDRELT
jgi:hydrogenase maturation protease